MTTDDLELMLLHSHHFHFYPLLEQWSLPLLHMWTPFVKPLQRVVPSWTLISTTRVSKLRSTAFSNLCPPVPSSANSFQILQLAVCLLLLPVRCCLTNATLSDIPSFCGALNFLDSQLLFHAAFPSFARKSVFTLQPVVPSTAPFVDGNNTQTNTIQQCLRLNAAC
jgi:hypothetical protein